ncbi:MAG: hypothetical protein OXT09_13355 [Myxococcales bacterium]|nr:hypothetical protein [Myxococcales bacterium]
MRLWAWSAACVLAAVAAGCGDAPPREPTLRDPGVDSASVPAPGSADDNDGDGLCNGTEPDYGADPEVFDTDGDGLPDLVEVANAFDVASPGSPAEDQLGLLEARPGATLELDVRTTVDGDGQALSGFFSPIGSGIWPQPHDVGEFFISAVAVSADPIDNVRGIDYDSERFGFVAGETRLGFHLLFEYPFDEGVECARAYPFRYRLKNDEGDTVAQRLFLVVVAPEGAGDIEYCLPDDCY